MIPASSTTPSGTSRKIRKRSTKKGKRPAKGNQQTQPKQHAAETTSINFIMGQMQQEEIEYSSEHQRSSSSDDNKLPKIPSRCGSLIDDLRMGSSNDYHTDEFADYEKDLKDDGGVDDDDDDDDPLLGSSAASFNFDFEEEAEAIISGRTQHRRNSRSSFRSNSRSSTTTPSSRNASISTSTSASQQQYHQDNSSFASYQSWADCSMPSLVSFCHDSFSTGSVVGGSGSGSVSGSGQQRERGYHSNSGSPAADLDTSHSCVDLSSVLEELEDIDLVLAQQTPPSPSQKEKKKDDHPRWQPILTRCKSADNVFDNNDDLFMLSSSTNNNDKIVATAKEEEKEEEESKTTKRTLPKRAHSTTSILKPKCASYVPDVMTLRESRWQCSTTDSTSISTSTHHHERRSDSTLVVLKNTPPRMPRGSSYDTNTNKSEHTVASTSTSTTYQSDSMLYNCSPPSRRPITPSKSRWQ